MAKISMMPYANNVKPQTKKMDSSKEAYGSENVSGSFSENHKFQEQTKFKDMMEEKQPMEDTKSTLSKEELEKKEAGQTLFEAGNVTVLGMLELQQMVVNHVPKLQLMVENQQQDQEMQKNLEPLGVDGTMRITDSVLTEKSSGGIETQIAQEKEDITNGVVLTDESLESQEVETGKTGLVMNHREMADERHQQDEDMAEKTTTDAALTKMLAARETGTQEMVSKVYEKVEKNEGFVRKYDIIKPSTITKIPELLGNKIVEKVDMRTNVLEIQIEPNHLGKISVKVEYQDGVASISIVCTEPKTLEIVKRSVHEISTIVEKNLQEETIVIVDEKRSNAYEQQENENGSAGRESEWERQREQRQRKERSRANRFLQELRLGLVE